MNPTPKPTDTPRSCERGGSGIFFPVDGSQEWKQPMPLMAVAYLAGLIWLFLGVGIIADTFMAAIENITSKEKEVQRGNETLRVRVWNATVANLTLMALGSSAPEIILSVLEIYVNDFYAGALGPSTIVGSAAFNLFCILAVCVVAIPEGPDKAKPDGRKIEALQVFFITGFFSVFAYIWLMIILVLPPTEHVCTFYEGVITFMLFPVLVLLAYLADIGYFQGKSAVQPTLPVAKGQEMSQVSIVPESNLASPSERDCLSRRRATRILGDMNTFGMRPEDIAKAIHYAHKAKKPVSRAVRRREAIRALTGGRSINVARNRFANMRRRALGAPGPALFFGDKEGYSCTNYSVHERDGKITLTVFRKSSKGTLIVDYETIEMNNEAKAGQDFAEKKGQLVFKDGEKLKRLDVQIFEDHDVEEDEKFKVKLTKTSDATISLEEGSEAIVTIIDDDNAGLLGVSKENESLVVKESQGVVLVPISRFSGFHGELKCKYKTEAVESSSMEGTHCATAGKDFIETTGELVFGVGEVEKKVSVQIINTQCEETKEACFAFKLFDITGPIKDRNFEADNLTCIIKIVDDRANLEKILDEAVSIAKNDEEEEEEPITWAQQFKEAITIRDDDDGESSASTIVLHCLTVPWKLLFAFCPPPTLCGGWLCFFCAMGMIAFVTALISDLASLLGCALNLSDSLTAITFVALGTSLPDTFASKAAAEADDTADAAIGNVTGSNGVNVFLGLGLPWAIASAYWEFGSIQNDEKEKWWGKYSDNDALKKYIKEKKFAFVVPASTLGPSVGVFCFCACVCFATLFYRRKKYGMELGGQSEGFLGAKQTSILFVFLWITYICGSIVIEATMG